MDALFSANGESMGISVNVNGERLLASFAGEGFVVLSEGNLYTGSRRFATDDDLQNFARRIKEDLTPEQLKSIRVKLIELNKRFVRCCIGSRELMAREQGDPFFNKRFSPNIKS